MKKRIYTALILLLSVATLFAADASKKQPKLVLDSDVWDFGTAKAGKQVSRTMFIRNEGTSTLLIEGIVEGCSCTSAKVDSKKIEPGKKTKLHLKYESSISGEVEKFVQIMSNDPTTPAKELTVKGVITGQGKK